MMKFKIKTIEIEISRKDQRYISGGLIGAGLAVFPYTAINQVAIVPSLCLLVGGFLITFWLEVINGEESD